MKLRNLTLFLGAFALFSHSSFAAALPVKFCVYEREMGSNTIKYTVSTSGDRFRLEIEIKQTGVTCLPFDSRCDYQSPRLDRESQFIWTGTTYTNAPVAVQYFPSEDAFEVTHAGQTNYMACE